MLFAHILPTIICACAVAQPLHDAITLTRPLAALHNGGLRAVTILTEDEPIEDKKSDDNDNELSDVSFVSDSDTDQDGDFDEDGVEFVDQRQNGTENYRIRVSGLLLVVASPEMAMPEPSTTVTPLVPPTAPPSGNQTLISLRNGAKRRFNVRRHGTNSEERKRKLTRYQSRIPAFIRAILRKYRNQQ